jgi:hypothetical protein
LPLKRVVHTHAHMRTHICHVATYTHASTCMNVCMYVDVEYTCAHCTNGGRGGNGFFFYRYMYVCINNRIIVMQNSQRIETNLKLLILLQNPKPRLT